LRKSSTIWIGARRPEAAVVPSPEVTTEIRRQPPSVEAHRFRWQRPKYSLAARQLDIFAAVAKWVPILIYNRLFPNQNERYHRRLGRALVDTTIGLGPTFIKIGQSLSTRVDFFSPIYTEALSQLQDRVPAFGVEEAIAIIESELDAPMAQLFATFDPIPIAAASLGQVHKAKLRTGAAVVVKIQRPGLQQLFDLDFKVIDKLLWWVGLLLPAKRSRELRAIYREFFTLLFQEIDYTKEGQNADRFRENFRDSERVTAPTIYWRFTTAKVLTMSYLSRDFRSLRIRPQANQSIGDLLLSQTDISRWFFSSRSASRQYGDRHRWQIGCLRFWDDGRTQRNLDSTDDRDFLGGDEKRQPSRYQTSDRDGADRSDGRHAADRTRH
jgi:hypothetical protein